MEPVSDEMLLMYIEDELDAPEAAVVERVLARDEELRRKVAQLIHDREQLRSLPTVSAPSRILANVLQSHLPPASAAVPPATGKSPASRAAATAIPTLKLSGQSISPPKKAFRWNIALAYTGMAAMLLLGLGVVFETLSDSKIISLAQNKPLPFSSAPSSIPPINVPGEPMAPFPSIAPPPAVAVTAPSADATLAQGDAGKAGGNLAPANPAPEPADRQAASSAESAAPSASPASPATPAPAVAVQTTSSAANSTDANQGDWQSADVYRDGALAGAGAPIVVSTPSAQKCQEEIADWVAKAHGQVISVADASMKSPGRHKSVIVVQLLPRQVNSLMAFLNAQGTQVAKLNPVTTRGPVSAAAAPAKASSTLVAVSEAHPQNPAPASSPSTQPASGSATFEPAKPETIKPISVTIMVNEQDR